MKLNLVVGCRRQCEFCMGHNNGIIEKLPFPNILIGDIDWIDVNILENEDLKEDLNQLIRLKDNKEIKNINLVQGIDYRIVTDDFLEQLYKLKIKPIRWAWDWSYDKIYDQLRFIKRLEKIGWKRKDMQIFMICNWKVLPSICNKKLDSLKYWNIQIADCWYPSGIKTCKGGIWDLDEVKQFRSKCRKHNQLVRHNGIDPEWKPK